jgi:DnaJ-class molecular chaperone
MYKTTRLVTESFFYYAPANCAWCSATGFVEAGSCPVCDGKGYVVLFQPKSECPPCKGTGGSSDLSGPSRCPICEGSGWMARDQR